MPARSPRAPHLFLPLLLLLPLSLPAQETGSPVAKPAATVQTLDGKLVDRLPLDRIGAAAILLPGVVSLEEGLSLRGGRIGDAATYLDGVPVSPGYRKSEIVFLPGFVPGPGQSFLEVGTNSLSSLEVVTGPLSPAFGRGQAGVIRLETLTPGGRFDARGSFETDRAFGSLHGPGLDRLQGQARGRLSNRLRVIGFATVEGRKSAESGPGAADDPIFVGAGIDTTVAVPSAINDPLADTVLVDVHRFAMARGRCDQFRGSANPDIADNYGEECQGVRFPATGSSNYQLLGKLDYAVGANTSIWVSGVASREQRRYFDPTLISVPLAGFKGTNRVLTLGGRHSLGVSGRPLTLNLSLSFQRDATVGGPLSPSSDLNTRDGFFLTGLEFLYDPESFPVNDELIRNIRNNIPGSRRSPLDLENTSQYSLIDQYRDSPYGFGGGPESGGPSGRLMFLEEDRKVVAGSLAWQFHPAHRIRAGAEITRHSIAGYSHLLTSQAHSDAFIADPVQSALFVEDEVRVGRFRMVAGARYERFRSDAERPFVLDTVASSPHFNTYSYFPTPNSYGAGGITFNGQPLLKLVPDEARSVISPRLQIAFEPTGGTTIRLGAARQNQMPDLAFVLSGVNTDLRVTNTQHVYGADLGFERTTNYELGARQEITPALTIDASFYLRKLADQVVVGLMAHRDPARLGELVDLLQMTDQGEGRIRGIDARLDYQRGPFTGFVGYAYQKTDQELSFPLGPGAVSVPFPHSRPHTVAGAGGIEVPGTWGRSTAARILRNTAAYATFRYSSGMAYTQCSLEFVNVSVLSGQVCPGTFDGDLLGARLPSVKQLDLRVTRSFAVAGKELVAYLDGRNVLNFENVLQVFAVTGTTSNASEAQAVYASDSAGFGDLGIANGIRGANGELDLTYGGAVASGCGNFVNTQFTPASPDCVYLIRAEERFGDGDHVFTVAEQRRASEAAYRTVRGRANFLGAPRRLRIGLEVRF